MAVQQTHARVAVGARRGRRRRAERGAALVEFALIAPVLFLLLFGIIEFGVALNDYQSLRHGVREGARQGAVQQYGSAGTSCTTLSAPTNVKKLICLTKDRIGLGDDVRVRVEYTAPTSDPGDFGTVSVCAQRPVDPFTGAIPAIDGIHLKSSIEMRLEKNLDSSITAPVTYAETAPSGSDWTEC